MCLLIWPVLLLLCNLISYDYESLIGLVVVMGRERVALWDC